MGFPLTGAWGRWSRSGFNSKDDFDVAIEGDSAQPRMEPKRRSARADSARATLDVLYKTNGASCSVSLKRAPAILQSPAEASNWRSFIGTRDSRYRDFAGLADCLG